MEVGAQIRKHRMDLNLSQEELAEKVYVTRQTISNWETGKSYPDIHSLLLLGSLFNVSLDQLIKGDAKIMKKEIKAAEVDKINLYSKISVMFLLVTFVSVIPLGLWLGAYAVIPCGLLFALAGIFIYKLEKVKKGNDIYTYKEIVKFMEGERLDEIEEQIERAKRPYQHALQFVIGGLAGISVCMLFEWIFNILK